MRHADDIMNAENWNRDLHNFQDYSDPALHDRASGKADIPLIQHRPLKEIPSPAPVSSKMDRSSEKASPGAAHSDAEAEKEIPLEQPESPAHDAPGSMEYIPVSQPRPMSMKSKGTKKRKSRRVSGRWPLVLFSFLITLISGVLVFFWLMQSDSTEIMASEENVYREQIDSAYAAADDDDAYLQAIPDQNVPDTYDTNSEWNSDTFDEENLSEPSSDNDIPDLDESEEFALKEDDLTEADGPRESAGDDSAPFEKQMVQKAEIKTDSIAGIKAKVGLQKDVLRSAITNKSGNIAAQPFPEKADQPVLTLQKVSAALSEPDAEPSVIPGSDSFSADYFAKASSEQTGKSDLSEDDAINQLQEEKDNMDSVNPVTDTQESLEPAPLYQTGAKPSYQVAPVKESHGLGARSIPGKRQQPTLLVRKQPSGRRDSEKTLQTTAFRDSSSGVGSLSEYMPSGLSAALKEMFILYEDQFDDHSGNWPEFDNSKASAVIEDGEYHIEQKTASGGHMLLQPNGVASNMDYEINISIRSVSSSGDNSYGFVFGAENSKSNHSFQIRNGKSYVIEKVIDGSSVELAAGEIDNIFISSSSRRTLKLVKNQDRVRFYIDDFYIDEIRNVELAGDKVGFIVKGPVKIAVDWTKTQIRFQDKIS